jgi:RNA polymerase sigma-70 factor (ECF subfamily)
VVSNIVPPKEIEDIVQETYVRVCQVEKPSEIRCHRSFMLKVARNLAFDYVKKAETRLVTSMNNGEFLELQETLSFSGEDEVYEEVASHE